MPQRKRIFVGSSGEQRRLAEVLAQALSQSGYAVVRWWEAVPPTGFTLETLAYHAQNVDGAVFLCFEDDRTWYRGVETASVRDSVMLELGLFLSHVSPVGARAWQEISNDPRYMSPDNAARLRGLIRPTIDGLAVQAFGSLQIERARQLAELIVGAAHLAQGRGDVEA